MNKKSLLEILESYGVSPQRQKGQNFLIDDNILESMIKNINFDKGTKNILEVGPGLGVLSRKILARGCTLTAIEIDKKIHNFLDDTLVKEPNFTLIKADACKIDLFEATSYKPFRCIANLPYAISSVFVSHLLRCQILPEEAFFLVQEEMGQRLVASYGTKLYNALSIRVQTCYDVKILKRVPPSVFYPEPKVYSVFLSMKKKDKVYPYYSELEKLAKLVFLQRRKKFVKMAKQVYPQERLLQGLEFLKLSKDVRPEQISVENFQKLVIFLMEKG